MKKLTVSEINTLGTDTRYELAKAVRMPDVSMLGDDDILQRLLAMTVEGSLTVEDEAMETLLTGHLGQTADTKPKTDPVHFFYGSHRRANTEFVGLTIFEAIEQLRPVWNIGHNIRVYLNGHEITATETKGKMLSASDRVELSAPASEKT